jgi:hypothetical protein
MDAFISGASAAQRSAENEHFAGYGLPTKPEYLLFKI